MKNKFFGPSTLIAAAFIGPGTVTVCSMAGVQHGYELLWALLFSIISTMVLQEMAARIGWYTQTGLGEVIRARKTGLAGLMMFGLVVFAILVGNGAYEAGNIGGAIMGMNLFGDHSFIWALMIGLLAFLILFFGKYKHIERFLIGLVLLMSLAFFISLIIIKPSLSEIMKGFIPNFKTSNDWLMVMGLIGTTVVPYNLFLHASLISKKYDRTSHLSDIRTESIIAITLGGVISLMIIIVAASAAGKVNTITSAADLAIQLEPLMGSFARYGIGIGLFAAGLSSAITAPLAAALAASELFDWDKKGIKYQAVWMGILGIGVLFSMLGFKPVLIIKFAQIMNGLLLPIIAIYLFYLVNQKSLLKEKVNGLLLNFLAVFVIVITILLSIKTLNSVLNIF